MRKTFIIWQAAGILFVALAFFIPEQSGSLWPSVISSGIAGLIYLALFFWFWIGKVKASGKRKAIGWTLAVIVIFSIGSAGISYETTQRQTKLLPEIRTTIETALAEVHVKEALLTTLRDYKSNKSNVADPRFDEHFRNNYDSLLTGEGEFLYEGSNRTGEEDDKNLKIYLAHSDADSVVLIAESFYMDGDNPAFRNYSGAEGRFQARGILTKEGVRYERAN